MIKNENNTFIWTEIVNCAEIGAVMLDSFHKHHPELVLNVYCTNQDKEYIEAELPMLTTNRMVPCFDFHIIDDSVLSLYSQGHKGTAHIFAQVLRKSGIEYAVHIDSDVFVKAPFINDLLERLDVNVSAVGTRRAYADNLGGAVVNGPDTISTYCMAIKTNDIPYYDFNTFALMCEGAFNPTPFDTLDFFDPVIHAMICSGKNIAFLPPKLYGGQLTNGKGKCFEHYKSNAHLDVGSKLAHFGGVGSGLANIKGLSESQKSYTDWAVGRFHIFRDLFLANKNFPVVNVSECIVGSDGRWNSGTYNSEIFELVKKEIEDKKNVALEKWFASNGDHKLRLLGHDLPYKSMVWDVGAYTGEWAKAMHARYGCDMVLYEPVDKFYSKCRESFEWNTNVIVECCGLGNSRRSDKIILSDDASSTHIGDSGLSDTIFIEDVAKELTYEKTNKKTKKVDLLKLNVEGAEYEILQRILQAKIATKFNSIMVQFHDFVPNCEELYAKIADKLSETHVLKWRYDFVWEKWEIKDKYK